MADAVTTQTIQSGSNKKSLLFTNVSDGTGEAAVQKIDISALAGAPAKVHITRVWWCCSGMQIRILFDHTVPDTVLVLDGMGYWDFTDVGGVGDPGSAGGTGDILFTTIGHTANDSYTVGLEVTWP